MAVLGGLAVSYERGTPVFGVGLVGETFWCRNIAAFLERALCRRKGLPDGASEFLEICRTRDAREHFGRDDMNNRTRRA